MKMADVRIGKRYQTHSGFTCVVTEKGLRSEHQRHSPKTDVYVMWDRNGKTGQIAARELSRPLIFLSTQEGA